MGRLLDSFSIILYEIENIQYFEVDAYEKLMPIGSSAYEKLVPTNSMEFVIIQIIWQAVISRFTNHFS